MRTSSPRTAVTFVMEPVLPGTLAVVTVGGADQATTLYASVLPMGPSAHPGDGVLPPGPPFIPTVVQRTDETLTVEMPAGPMAAFAFSTHEKPDNATAWIANRPRLDWLVSSQAQLGSVVRLIGRNLVAASEYPTVDPLKPLSFGGRKVGLTRVVVRLRGGSSYIELPVEQSSCYEVFVRIPVSLGVGQYDFFAHNGLGAAMGWSEAIAIEVVPAEVWPTKVFKVDDLLSHSHSHSGGGGGDGSGGDSDGVADAAIAKALAAIEANGGGVLEFGPRTYKINRTIVVPPRTVVRGAGCQHTLLLLPGQGEVRPPYVAITGDRDFVVEDLRIKAVYATFLIYAPHFVPQSFDEAYLLDCKPAANRARNITVRRCHLSQHPMSHVDRRGDREFVEMIENRLRKQGHQAPVGMQCIQIAGDDIQVLDNIVVGAGGGVVLNRCRHVRVAGNLLKAGPGGTAMMTYSRLYWPEGDPAVTGGAEVHNSYCRQILIEDNDITAHSENARNLIALLYGGEDLHVARNHIHDIEPTTDAEALLTHLWSARWHTPRVKMTGPTTGRIIDPGGEVKNERLDGACVDIVAGRGVGQVRRIIKREGDAIELEQPFRVDPDETSMTVFTAPPPFWRLSFIDNRVISPAVNIIVWGNSCDTVIDGNYTADGPGITIWPVRIRGDQKVWGGVAFTSVINNTVDRGWSTPQTESKVLAGAVGIIILATLDPSCTADGYDVLGLVVRNNLALNNTGIGMRVTFAVKDSGGQTVRWRLHDSGIVVEKNHCQDTVVGVAIEKDARAVERGNTAANVQFPMVLSDPTIAGW